MLDRTIRLRSSFAALVLACSAAAQPGEALLFAAAADAQPAPEDRFRLGALRFGMSIEDARAALPEVQWTVADRHAETGRPYVIRGPRAIALAGIEFDLELGSRPLGALAWTLESNATARDAAECEQRTLAVVAELERHFGAFHEPAPPISGESRVRAGQSSFAVVSAADARLRSISRETALRKDPEKLWVRSRHMPAGPDDAEVRVGADYERARQRACGIDIHITGSAPALGSVTTLGQPTISYRNRTLRKVGAPAETLHFTISCLVHAGTGEISSCRRGDGDADPYRALAADWALHYRVALENAQKDDERRLAVEVPVQMGPADLRTPNVSSGRRLDPAQVKVKKRSGGSSVSDPDLKAPAEVSVICEVMEDGSLICSVKPGTTVSATLAAAAVDAAERVEVDPTLRDGTSAVGGLIEHKFVFKPRGNDG